MDVMTSLIRKFLLWLRGKESSISLVGYKVANHRVAFLINLLVVETFITKTAELDLLFNEHISFFKKGLWVRDLHPKRMHHQNALGASADIAHFIDFFLNKLMIIMILSMSILSVIYDDQKLIPNLNCGRLMANIKFSNFVNSYSKHIITKRNFICFSTI